jgi:hypothetical protein
MVGLAKLNFPSGFGGSVVGVCCLVLTLNFPAAGCVWTFEVFGFGSDDVDVACCWPKTAGDFSFPTGIWN